MRSPGRSRRGVSPRHHPVRGDRLAGRDARPSRHPELRERQPGRVQHDPRGRSALGRGRDPARRRQGARRRAARAGGSPATRARTQRRRRRSRATSGRCGRGSAAARASRPRAARQLGVFPPYFPDLSDLVARRARSCSATRRRRCWSPPRPGWRAPVLWAAFDWPNGWGPDPSAGLIVFSVLERRDDPREVPPRPSRATV